MFNSGGRGLSVSLKEEGRKRKKVCVYDRRFPQKEVKDRGKWLETGGLDFNDFLGVLYKAAAAAQTTAAKTDKPRKMNEKTCIFARSLDLVSVPPKASGYIIRMFDHHQCEPNVKTQIFTLENLGFAISPHEAFVVATTDRTVMDFDKFEKLQDGSTLLLLQQENQALSVATEERIKFEPHYRTLVESGMYEYYASEGQKSLPYALAELIDNALSATAKNTGERTIDIRMLFDETLGKPAVIVLDNGCGMTSKQLNNWAVYRLSKFSRENSKFATKQDGYVRPDPVRHSLNSDISYFGVGGKQAIFYIGDSTRMISKPIGSPDVHELVLSKEEFERKERNKEEIYSGIIRNRKRGDFSHLKKDDERFLRELIAEETRRQSFTAVVITGIRPEHIDLLKNEFAMWTRQLANIYHYYIHGVNGNNLESSSTNSDDASKIDIQIILRHKSPRLPNVLNLREVDNDMQTLYINAAFDTFEFKATTEQKCGAVEGVIRYHPFRYDKETYPKDPSAAQASCEDNDDNDDNDSEDLHQARGKRPIFDCFWNGRLIPYTQVSEFDWCTWTNRSKVPAECYNRISGVLFTDDRFEVTTNKLTYMDLPLRLKSKETSFTRVINGQTKRGDIKKEFTQWLQSCHEKWDKQIQFLGYKGTITRTDLATKKMQHPWATFSSIEWDGKTYKTGQLVKSQKTQPILYGSVVQFLLYGEHKGDVFATGGEVQLTREPKGLYDETKTIFISKLDRIASDEVIQKHINSEFAKLPEKLRVTWPEENPWPQNAVRPAGTVMGPLKIEILNHNEESLARMPSVTQGPGKKLVVELRIIHHSKKDEEVVLFVCRHSPNWAFWFKPIENLTRLGKYTLHLKTLMNENNATVFGGRELPSYKLDFTIKAGCADSFMIDTMSSTVHVGEPFDIPLLLKDVYGHLATPPPNLRPVLQCSVLELSYEKVDSTGDTFTIRSVRARGKIPHHQRTKTYDLKVTLPGLKKDTQSINIIPFPGKPHSLHVTPEDDPVTVENGNPVSFDVEIHDESGNISAHPKLIVRCQVEGFPISVTDCSVTGTGQLVTKPIQVQMMKGEPRKLKVQFSVPSHKNLALVVRELMMMPSTRVSSMELYSHDDENLVLRDNEKIEWLAGGSLENLFYRLYDEAGREVPLTAEIAAKIKVNWTADVNLEDLVQGKLPDVQVPTKVKEPHFYQVSYQEQSVSVSFNIVPRPDESVRLKATLQQSTVRLGETLPGGIYLELVDQYDNETKALTSTCVEKMNVKAEDLDKSAITFKWQESSSSVLVTGIQFHSGAPGSREICFTYGTYVEQVIVKVTAGVPAFLKLISEPKKPLGVLNDSGITTPFVVQLCDMLGNPSPDQRVVVEFKSSSPMLKVTTNVTSQPVNAEGKATFIVNKVSGPKGCHQLLFIGSFNKNPIPGPSVNFTVIPNANKPVCLSVEYDAGAKLAAGEKFPVFYVTVVSDEGSPITTFQPADVSMFLWRGLPAGDKPPPTATELKCNKPLGNDRNHCFHFRDKDIPENIGRHTIQFTLRIDQTKVLLSSEQIAVTVVANQPVGVKPDSQPQTPVVSYSKDISSRILVENMTLGIVDSYGNPAGQDLDGKVIVFIKSSKGNNNTNIPLFETKTSSVQFSLVKGKVHINRLAVMENSPGVDGSSYILFFQPQVSMFSMPLAAFELCFHFCNDVEKQRRMSELTKKKDELTAAVSAYREFFKGNTDLLQQLRDFHSDIVKQEADQREVLNRRSVNVAPSASIPDIDRLLAERTTEVDRILEMSRRKFTVRDHFRGQQDVLGMVGHLAFVQDDDAARVISWHISGDMDCVITKTTAAARRIYDDTGGRQQVMALDSVYVLPGDRPLPHIKNGHVLFQPPGNPIHARNLLIYPKDKESCHMVFKNLLGDTILIDDLDSANSYRRAVVQSKTPCPTILTRQGDRVSAKGKFGGAQNRAPPINKLRVFGAPLPPQYQTLMEERDLLNKYRATLQKKDDAAKDVDSHLKTMTSPEIMKKQQEIKEKEKQLQEIEKQCVATPVRPEKRGAAGAAETSGFSTKRTRQSST